MGMPRFQDPVTTVEQLLALPEDGLRHELLDGTHAVTPAPSYHHQAIVSLLFQALTSALRSVPELKVMTSPADLAHGPRLLLQPDLFVFRLDPKHPIRSWKDIGVPVLAVEILSPSTASRDRGRKRLIYQRLGVGEYWIVDPDSRLIECWRPGDTRPEIVTATLTWTFEGERHLELAVKELFADLPDPEGV